MAKSKTSAPKPIVYLSSINSENGLYHHEGCGCHHCERILKENRVRFKSTDRAERRGLRLCELCRQKSKQRKIGEYA